MSVFYISLAFLLLVFGASCFNLGQRRGYRVTLKSLMKGQILFLSQRRQWLDDNRGCLTRQDFDKAYYSYETIGQLIAGWYRYFAGVRSDKELTALKARIKAELEDYLELLEGIGEVRGFNADAER
jgi:hypothetical protein